MKRTPKPGLSAPFTWRDIEFTPEPTLPGFYRSARLVFRDHRSADWRVQLAGESWHARLKVGADRFPGRGATAEEALDAAAAEAREVCRLVRKMLPALPQAPKPARKRRAS